MKDKAFKELCASIKHAGKVVRGEVCASRTFSADSVFVRGTRAKLGLSQHEFANMLGLSVATLRNWEQGRTKPEGPARALLIVAAQNPGAVYKALRIVVLEVKQLPFQRNNGRPSWEAHLRRGGKEVRREGATRELAVKNATAAINGVVNGEEIA